MALFYAALFVEPLVLIGGLGDPYQEKKAKNPDLASHSVFTAQIYSYYRKEGKQMTILLTLLIVILMLLNYLQSREINRLKALITFDEEALRQEAKALLKTKDKVFTIKKLREKNYPLSLVQAKKIVDQAESE
ncbi:hypothetical protein E4665_11610 [Sporolactobacillus shoreae]|uniref:Ribosomal protein L7/L12 C-terminal domain-containing protein n=1 Tax=Sporolactobacillus shoreae TaxID=1465501 RepID=A0A4Z0GKT6_9BACL|nr:hypothetical protein [Sporolactobacillus shoreae]TGA97489.1 hypothetical protein E4665_11610 [Sporolactobacillus shoreae]